MWLVNNCPVFLTMLAPRQPRYGFEAHMCITHLGHFAVGSAC